MYKKLEYNDCGNSIKTKKRSEFSVQLKRVDYQTSAAKITELKLDLPGADLKIVGNPSNQILLEIEWPEENSHHQRRLVPYIEGTTVYIADKKKHHYIGKDPVQIKISVPQTLHLDLHLSIGGKITLDNMFGNLNISMKSGEINGSIFSKKVNIELQAGEIYLEHLEGQTKIRNNFGNVTLLFDSLYKNDKVDVKTGIGNIAIQFPNGFFLGSADKKSLNNNTLGATVKVATKLGKITYGTASKPRVLEQLPNEILLQIFGFFNPKALLRVGAVCKNWGLVAHDNSLWRKHFLSNFPESIEKPIDNKINWEDCYRKKYLNNQPAQSSTTQNKHTYFKQHVPTVPNLTVMAYVAGSQNCNIS